jgi:hypothetical protein
MSDPHRVSRPPNRVSVGQADVPVTPVPCIGAPREELGSGEPTIVVRRFALLQSYDSLASMQMYGQPIFACVHGSFADDDLVACARSRRFRDHSIGAIMFHVNATRSDEWRAQCERIAQVLNDIRPVGSIPVRAEHLRRAARPVVGAGRALISVVMAHEDGEWLHQAIALHREDR